MVDTNQRMTRAVTRSSILQSLFQGGNLIPTLLILSLASRNTNLESKLEQFANIALTTKDTLRQFNNSVTGLQNLIVQTLELQGKR